MCRRSTFAQANSRRFEKGCNKKHTAAKLREQSQETKAVIVFFFFETLTGGVLCPTWSTIQLITIVIQRKLSI